MTWISKQTADDKEIQQQIIAAGRLPKHIAIIMDGNGRWAAERKMPRVAGHQSGISSVRDIVEAASLLGIKNLTLYAFSMENWRRPRTEVNLLMDLLVRYLREELEEMHQNNIRLQAIGKLNALPKNVQKQLYDSMDIMKGNTGLTLTLALSYSGRWDIVRAVQMIALDARRGKISPEDITEEVFSTYLLTHTMPDPDLVIRTSGEMRLSNFLLWETAYSEIYITDKLWPDFRRNDLYTALFDYIKRERRFGKTSQQIAEEKTNENYVQRIINAFKSS